MAADESNIANRCMIHASELGCMLGKNVRGMFQTLGKNPRKMKAGWMIPASPDLIGHHSIVVTPSMVGKRVAIAMYVEVKTNDGVVAREQQHFIDNAIKAGAITGVARSPQQLAIILRNYLDALCKA